MNTWMLLQEQHAKPKIHMIGQKYSVLVWAKMSQWKSLMHMLLNLTSETVYVTLILLVTLIDTLKVVLDD